MHRGRVYVCFAAAPSIAPAHRRDGWRAGENFDSGNVFPGKTCERRFDERGHFDYVCILHTGQVGSVVVR